MDVLWGGVWYIFPPAGFAFSFAFLFAMIVNIYYHLNKVASGAINIVESKKLLLLCSRAWAITHHCLKYI